MSDLRMPATIEFGWVRTLRYLPDFGRHEAAVTLRITEVGSVTRDVEVITSVADHQDEAPEALRQRLVLDAARLMRLSEAGFETPDLAVAA